MRYLLILALIATACSYDQLEIHKFSQDISELIQSNSPCIWQISKSYASIDVQSGKVPNISLALEQQCNEGYEITLIDAEHIETITISKTVLVQISGQNTTSGKRMIIGGGSENSGEGEYIIRTDSTSTGDIIVQNIEMREWNGGLIRCDGGKSVTLRDSLFNGGGSIVHNTDGILNIQSDEFIGEWIHVPIDPFIFATKGSINIYNSLFKKGSFKGDRNGCIVCCGTVTQCTIDECEFIENKFNVGSAAVLITTPTCIQMIIKGTASKRTTISGLGTKNPIKGNFIKTVSSKISISYTDFIDSTFSGLGNAVKIDDQQASEISLIWCNFTKLGTNSGGQLSSCIHSMLSSENGFLFNAEYCIFSDCRYSGLSQVSGNAITIQSQSSDRSAVRQVKFSECIITNNRGNGYCGAVLIDSLTKCTINFIGSFFNENNGTEVNDIWIRSTNSLSELNISNFNTSFSDCLQPHIVTINDQLESTYNLNHFPGVIFVSNKIIIETRDGSRDKPNQRILDSFPKLDYQTKPIQMPRTIYVIEEIWDEYLYGVSFTNPLVIKSGLADDSNGIKRKVTWITTSSSNVIIYYNKGDLTLENIQFNFTNVSNSFRPFHEHIWIVTSGSNNSSFTAISCIFNGLGIYGQIFHYLIGAYNLKFMVVKDCIFQDAYMTLGGVRFESNIQNAEYLVQNCIFQNIKANSGEHVGAILIFGRAINQKASVINCTFDHCMIYNTPAALYIYTETAYTSTAKYFMNNNKFINCQGDRAGGIYLYYTTNIQFFDNEFYNNSNNNGNYNSQDSYIIWSTLPTGWNVANTLSNLPSLFDGSITDSNNSIYYTAASNNLGFISIAKHEYIYFINQKASISNQNGNDEQNPMKTVQSTIQQSNRNSKLFFNLIGIQHNESIIINSNSVWKLVEIKSIQGLETQMRRSSGDINGAIITLTLDSITPSTVQYVIMIVDYGFFVIQQSNKEQLTLSNIEFIGAGTVKQEGLALLSIEYSSFKLSNNMSTILSFVQAIRGQLEINSCSFGTSLETQLGSPAIQTSSQCTNIKFTQAIFYNLHSIITNGEQKASGAVIEMGEKTEVEFTDCTFIHCIDSSSDIQHSTGAVCIILKSSDSLIHQLSDEQTIQSTISFNQCQFTGCIGGSSGAIQSISNQSLLNLRLNIIIDKCSFNNCGNNYSIVGACWFNGESVNNNYGEASITNNQFRNCIGIKAGGILFGENMQPINARNNTFSNISIELTKCLVTIDIFFSSKEFLDQAGGIVQVAQGYKYEQNQQQNTIGEIKIKGFSSNFAPYLDCVSRNEEEQCGQIPCGGELNLKPEQCEYIEDEDNDQECKQKCVPSLNTPISECGCLPENDPRIACKQVCIPTKDSLINELCPCFLIGDPREACKTISIPTEDTPVTVDNPCLAHNDPREACKTISVPTEDTPVTVDNPCLAYNDPREACKTISIPTPDTPVTVDNPCLAHNDPREACKTISIPTEDTPVTVDNPCLAYNDPRDVCQKACIPLADTPINVCGCLEINDPRSQCQKSCVPKANTPINECCCFDIDDPRDECKGKTQSGLDDEKQQDQSEIDNPKQQQEEAKKEGLSSGFIALIVISSVLAIIIIILIIVIIHLIRKKKIFRTGEELIVVRSNANNQTNNNQQEDIIQEQNRFVVHSNENDLRNNYKSEYDQDTPQQQVNQQQNIKQISLKRNIFELNGKQKLQINPNSPPSSSHQQDRPQTNISIPSTPSSLNSYSPNQQ